MRRLTTLLAAICLCTNVWCADDDTKQPPVQVAPETGQVTVASKGADVRNVLFDLFEQTKKSFVLEPNVRFVLYLALTGVEFDEALQIICTQANLEYEIDNGIYYITKSSTAAKSASKPPAPVVKPKPAGKLTDQDLQAKLTTRLRMTDLREVFQQISDQTGVKIEVSDRVPKYKVDAYLIDTSLKYALDVLTRAADLTYSRTENKSILIDVAEPH